MPLSDRPLFTHEFEDASDFTPESGSIYIYGVTSEPRSEIAVDLMKRSAGVRFVELREAEGLTFETSVPGFERVFIRRRSRLDEFIKSLGAGLVYLDITGFHTADP